MACLLPLLVCVACAGRRDAARGADIGPQAALYRVRLDEGPEGQVRRFRLLLYAESPDRLHGEVITPVGSTALVVDAGGGRVSVLFVRDKVAFVGAADGESLHELLGLRVGVAELVAALLDGRAPPGVATLERTPAGPGYPQRLLLSAPPRSVGMELKRRRPLRGATSSLCSGTPPPGVEVRPLAAMSDAELPGVETVEREQP